MADNVTANSGSGGATFATDDISSVHYPRTKLIHGADGVNDGDVSTANPLPVMQTPSDTWAYAAIAATASGDTTLVAAQGVGNKIRVLSALVVVDTAVTVRFEDGTGGTALTGLMALAANSGFSMPYNPAGWFEGSANTLLNLETSATAGVSGCLTYIVTT